MKKSIFALLAAMLAASATAETVSAEAAQDSGKIIAFGTIVEKNGLPTLEGQTEFSRFKGPEMCWLAAGLNPGGNYLASIKFKSPDAADFKIGGNALSKSGDGTEHEQAFTAAADRNGQVYQCWKFERNDPLGRYAVTVNVGGNAAASFEFNVVP